LRLLFEQRSPAEDDEEPDHHAQPFALTPEIDRWKIDLPAVTDFTEHPGDRITLPGTTRIVSCRPCEGRGRTPCPRCHGKQRVLVPRQLSAPPATASAATAAATFPNESVGEARSSARRSGSNTAQVDEPPTSAPPPPAPRTEQVLVPCPECAGRGGITCARCEGVGRLVQRKTFRWHRQADLLRTQDDRLALDENWLQRTCKAEVIYTERQAGGFRPEWSAISTLAPTLAQAQQRADADTRIVLSELTISFIPVTDILFDLGKPGDDGLYKLTIYGFENIIPADWRFLNWERVITISLVTFFTLASTIMAYFAFFYGR
jgi:hypothetical protein